MTSGVRIQHTKGDKIYLHVGCKRCPRRKDMLAGRSEYDQMKYVNLHQSEVDETKILKNIWNTVSYGGKDRLAAER